jgi:CRP-like cAMP-binding protein
LTVDADFPKQGPVTRKRVADYRDLLLAGRWFRDLSETFQDALISMSHLREAAANEVLFARGAACSSMFCVLQGKLRVTGGLARGKESLLTIVEPPSWVGEVSLFDSAPRSHELTAAVDSLLVHVPQQALLSYLDAHPHHWRDLGRLVTSKLRLTFLGLEDASLSTRERIARRLVLIADGYGQWADRSYSLVDLSQETLATMVSSSRQTVNQVLRKLEEEGMVRVAYAGVEVVDVVALRRVAGAEKPSY